MDQGRVNGRLLIDGPGDAAWNMAVDQAILEAVSAGAAPLLRFYQWERPTLSLGYFQSLAERAQHVSSSSLPVVRRSTGGGAIVHDRELTYSLTLPIQDRASLAVQRLYDVVHGAIERAFQQFGVAIARVGPQARSAPQPPFLCFQRRTAEDLQCGGYKVGGSAQRRTSGAVLQHGSLLLRVSEHAPELPGIYDLIGRHLEMQELMSTIAAELPGGGPWSPSHLTPEESERAEYWSQTRFSHSDWLQRRP